MEGRIMAAEQIREPVIAGSWYPGDPSSLRQKIQEFLNKASVPDLQGRLVALISPHAGYTYSGQVAAYAYKLLEREKFASAIIAPDYSYIKSWCHENNISGSTHAEWLENNHLVDMFREEVKKYNEIVSDFEKINRYRLVTDIWSPSTGELSATLKMKRKFITEKYQYLIDQIYMKQAEG